MYQRDIQFLPIKITREEFVNIVFDIGLQYCHGYDTIIAAVQIGDKFVSTIKDNTCDISIPIDKDGYISSSNDDNASYDDDDEDIFATNDELQVNKCANSLSITERYYSNELAYTTTVLVCKANEDDGYKSIETAVTDTGNGYVYILEWEICHVIGFNVKINNFMTFIGRLLDIIGITSVLPSVFWDLSKDICMNIELLKINPLTILIGCILLNHMGKLKAIRTNKERVFHNIMVQVSKEYEIDLEELLRKYIDIFT